MSINLAIPETNMITLKPRISVIGVGGGGGNAVNNMIAKNLEGVDFIVANTDAQALANSKSGRKIQLGIETTRGLGAGACPEVGRKAAEEATEEIEKELEGANMVFITAGMGGGTGSGAAPVVARLAKQKGILTIGVVTKPFQFEGKRRYQIAEEALKDFTEAVDSIIIIPNQNLFRIADKSTTLADAFVMADNVLYDGVRSITDLMIMPGLINLDFADIKSIMEDKGKAIMGTGEAEGENRAIKAAEQALSNPLLDDSNMKGAKGVLINITGGMDITLFEIDEAANRIKEEVDEEANIIFGSSFDENLAGKIRVSIVATGIENSSMETIKNKPQPIAVNYIEESYSEENILPATPSEEMDSKLAKFSATIQTNEDTTLEETNQENISINNNQEETTKDNENNNQEKSSFIQSSSLNDIPQASSLFNAILNKNEFSDADSQLETLLSETNNTFTSKTKPQIVEEEPELFGHNPQLFVAPKDDNTEKLIINDDDDDEEYTPTLIERVTGFSIARRNRKKKQEIEHHQEPITPTFTNSDDEDNNVDLDIPSFLRRR